MTALLARLVLSIALLLQGVGVIASEIGTAVRPHCRMSMSGDQGKPAKMPCCHGDECTMPSCAEGCVMSGASFIAPQFSSNVANATAQLVWEPSRDARSLDSSPPLRPPIV